jgi:hypothetical protein
MCTRRQRRHPMSNEELGFIDDDGRLETDSSRSS